MDATFKESIDGKGTVARTGRKTVDMERQRMDQSYRGEGSGGDDGHGDHHIGGNAMDNQQYEPWC